MYTLKQLADLLGIACLPGFEERPITGLRSLSEAGETELSVLSADKYVRQYKNTRAGAVLASRKLRFTPRDEIPTLIVEDAELALVKCLEALAPPIGHPKPGVHPSAVVAESAVIGENSAIAPNVTVGERVKIGKNVRLHPGVVVCDDCVIGDDCTLYPNVVLRDRTMLGNRVIIHAGSVLGSDGFGYHWDGRRHAKVPQIGNVVIEDDVEIGSCTCVDRAKFNQTRIGRGTKIDNLVQIGHNVIIGQHAILCGQSGVAGTTTIGNGVVLGGAAHVRDHVTVGDGVMAAGAAGIADDVEAKSMVSGMPAIPHRQQLREQAAVRRLPEMLIQMRKLQEEVQQLRTMLEAAKGT
ncbi:MAG TPA: UDP-3-O-(3-hydroxymyristoyl)glucosamine N-acyltransferase [Tepidisphaeraceae bacterium]